jgi:thiamine transport system permease protein
LRTPRALGPLLAAVPLAWLTVFFAWPVATLVTRVGPVRVDADVVWFTLWQAVVSTALTLAAGIVPAYVLARFEFPMRRLVLATATVPFMLPTVVVGAAFLALLPERLHASATAVIVAHVYFNVAVVVRLVGSMWALIPHDLTDAARTLGATRWQVAREVVLPLLRSGIASAAVVTFLFSFTSYGVVTLLGGPSRPTVEAEIVRRATQLGDVEGAVALSMLQVVLLATVVALSSRLQRRSTQRLGGAPLRRRPRTRPDRRLVGTVAIGTAAVMCTPVGALVLRSMWTSDGLSLTAWRTLGGTGQRPGASTGVDPTAAIATSLGIAAVATAISLVVGTLGAFAVSVARQRRTSPLDVGLMLPLGTSAVTVGLGMLITFDRPPVDWRDEWWLVPVGHSLIAVPFVVRSILPAVRRVPAAHLDAAATLGATPLRGWWEVVARRSTRAIAVAAGLSAAISLGEFGATTFLTRTGRDTMPVVIARLLGRAGDIPRAQAFAMATVLFAVTAAIVVVADREESRHVSG